MSETPMSETPSSESPKRDIRTRWRDLRTNHGWATVSLAAAGILVFGGLAGFGIGYATADNGPEHHMDGPRHGHSRDDGNGGPGRTGPGRPPDRPDGGQGPGFR
jgi:hypothetical protein